MGICDGTINASSYIQVWNSKCCPPDDVIFEVGSGTYKGMGMLKCMVKGMSAIQADENAQCKVVHGLLKEDQAKNLLHPVLERAKFIYTYIYIYINPTKFLL